VYFVKARTLQAILEFQVIVESGTGDRTLHQLQQAHVRSVRACIGTSFVVHFSLIADDAEQLDQQQTPIVWGERCNGLQLS
jgi:hypothetical protein